MPNWGEVAEKLKSPEEILAQLRCQYLGLMKEYTGRNVIAYYSAFMQKPGISATAIDDNDKNAFMQMVAGISKDEREKGVDIILHTPGGDLAATESLVYYLKEIFGNNIRVFVPQMAMSAGTMIALSANVIIMGKESNLGPIDPQFGGISCYGVVEEFERALRDVKTDPSSAVIWANIIGKYHPTFIGDCEKAINWGKSMVTKWLADNMFSQEEDKEKKAKQVVENLSNHEKTFAHNWHIHSTDLTDWGVKVQMLENFPKEKKGDCEDLQDCVLTLHHIFMQTLAITNILKLIENGHDSMAVRSKIN